MPRPTLRPMEAADDGAAVGAAAGRPTPVPRSRCRRCRPPGRRSSPIRPAAARKPRAVDLGLGDAAGAWSRDLVRSRRCLLRSRRWRDRLSDLAREDQVRCIEPAHEDRITRSQALARSRPRRVLAADDRARPPDRSAPGTRSGRRDRCPGGCVPRTDDQPSPAAPASAGTTSSRSGRVATVTACPGVRVAVASVTVPRRTRPRSLLTVTAAGSPGRPIRPCPG